MPNIEAHEKDTHIDCEFCNLPLQNGSAPFIEMHGCSDILAIPGLPESFNAVQDIVPVAEEGGHILLMPKKVGRGHYVSLALVENQEELQVARNTVVDSLRGAGYTNPIFTFEHGPGVIDGEEVACGGCHMDHAHGHMLLLPHGTTLEQIKAHMEALLAENGWENPDEMALPSEQLFTGIYDQTGAYPYLQIGMIDDQGETRAYTYPQMNRSWNVESQLLRRVVAEAVYGQYDVSYWHWRDITSGFAGQERLERLTHDVLRLRQRMGL